MRTSVNVRRPCWCKATLSPMSTKWVCTFEYGTNLRIDGNCWEHLCNCIKHFNLRFFHHRSLSRHNLRSTIPKAGYRFDPLLTQYKAKTTTHCLIKHASNTCLNCTSGLEAHRGTWSSRASCKIQVVFYLYVRLKRKMQTIQNGPSNDWSCGKKYKIEFPPESTLPPNPSSQLSLSKSSSIEGSRQ